MVNADLFLVNSEQDPKVLPDWNVLENHSVYFIHPLVLDHQQAQVYQDYKITLKSEISIIAEP